LVPIRQRPTMVPPRNRLPLRGRSAGPIPCLTGSVGLAALVALTVLVGGCSSGTDPVAAVDGTDISRTSLDELHVDPDAVTEDEAVGALLVLVLREAFTSRADSQLGIEPSSAEIQAAVDLQPADSRLTEARRLLDAELDLVRDLVEVELVMSESAGFDLAAAQEAFLLAKSNVCVRQIQLPSADDFPAVRQRLEAGEAFADVARDVSVDPFADREEGVGAGGDLGCSAPSALPAGLGQATLDAPLDVPTGPVVSSVGVHLIEVYGRLEPDPAVHHEEVLADAVGSQGPDLFRQWAVAVLQEVDVEIDESIGRWGVLPETDPVPTVVPPYRFADIVGGR